MGDRRVRKLGILQEEGSQGLERWLEAESERNLPEFKRQRPKHYYYYEWMKDRITQHCGALPDAVMDKMLNIEAGELDTLLNYPKGIQSKVWAPACESSVHFTDIGGIDAPSCKLIVTTKSMETNL